MRRYIMVYGILLILSIFDFALAAPVPEQEIYQACEDVGYTPENAITVLGKRGNELEELGGKYIENLFGKPESSGAHGPSSSAPSISMPSGSAPSEPLGLAPSSSAPPGLLPSGLDHESTNVIEGPAPDPASSTANHGHLLMRPLSPSSSGSSENDFEWEPPTAEELKEPLTLKKGELPSPDQFKQPQTLPPGSSEAGSDHEYVAAEPKPRPFNPGLSSPSPSEDDEYYTPPSTPGSLAGFGADHE